MHSVSYLAAIRNNDERIVALLLAAGAYIDELKCEIQNRIERTKADGFVNAPFLRPVCSSVLLFYLGFVSRLIHSSICILLVALNTY
jgi:hypothetical protein